MAKRPKENGSASPSNEQNVLIQKHSFAIPTPYSEGHVLNASEATALNQTYAENIRNNFAKTVKAAMAGGELSPEAVADLQAKLSEYAATYNFQGRRSARSVDPVEKLARQLAKRAIVMKMREQNKDPKQLPDGRMDQLVASLLDRNEKYRKEARHQIETTKALSADDLGLDDLAAA